MGELGIAFLAGMASFFSPCVLPLIPIYLAYLTGTTFQELSASTPRRLTLIHAGLFIAGFSMVFIAMGASASLLGSLLFRYRVWIERVGGGVLVLLGLWMAGLLKADFLFREARVHFREKPAGFFGSVLVGAAFAAGWTPCVGPVLAGILILASRSGSAAKGILLLSVYSLGFAVPLLLCAAAVERSSKVLNRVKPALPAIEKGMGAVLALLGAFLAAGGYGRFSGWLLSRFPGWVAFFGKMGL
ncbi:MAG: hypothetical protein A2X36_03905 [Elusimicrobia bacterium GWA2_69_24]|nr:MAG: hypothetical protein A2X36_03905 [Elusimicrobia bacterium GWA2_69_24]HBL18951.1 cytochrome C biogenesis protein [Elusimicrobiota bacterium]